MHTFNPLKQPLPIANYGLIGDGATAALVGCNGSIDWLCLPRFDSQPLFCALLDPQQGGSFGVHLRDAGTSHQYYVEDSGVLVTELQSNEAKVRITDALLLRRGTDLCEDARADRAELLRYIEILRGPAHIDVAITPFGGATFTAHGSGLTLSCHKRSDLQVQVLSSHHLHGPVDTITLKTGESLELVLSWGSTSHHHRAVSPQESLTSTVKAWQQWTGSMSYEGPHRTAVRRSAITLKMLSHFERGALVAAPTSSLPEVIGGERNWDYRYAWIRDAAFSVYALLRVGMTQEASAFLGWVLDAIEQSGDKPQVLYNLDGQPPPAEHTDAKLRGYMDSTPVRWGNAASLQTQHDIYGEILDCAYQWYTRFGDLSPELWPKLVRLANLAATTWRTPDRSIWEVRSSGKVFTYSAAMCQVAQDRIVRLAQHGAFALDVGRYERTAKDITGTILEEAWDERRQSLLSQLSAGAGLDAAVLALPLRRVVEPNHPKMIATVNTIAKELSAGNGLLMRYANREYDDGLGGREGAFVLCSFWLVDNLALQGKVDQAAELYDSLCARGGTLGLLPEQIDPSTGDFLGNYPQALSHVGLISSGVNLVRAQQRQAHGKRYPHKW